MLRFQWVAPAKVAAAPRRARFFAGGRVSGTGVRLWGVTTGYHHRRTWERRFRRCRCQYCNSQPAPNAARNSMNIMKVAVCSSIEVLSHDAGRRLRGWVRRRHVGVRGAKHHLDHRQKSRSAGGNL
jgi:hypothetical protein